MSFNNRPAPRAQGAPAAAPRPAQGQPAAQTQGARSNTQQGGNNRAPQSGGNQFSGGKKSGNQGGKTEFFKTFHYLGRGLYTVEEDDNFVFNADRLDYAASYSEGKDSKSGQSYVYCRANIHFGQDRDPNAPAKYIPRLPTPILSVAWGSWFKKNSDANSTSGGNDAPSFAPADANGDENANGDQNAAPAAESDATLQSSDKYWTLTANVIPHKFIPDDGTENPSEVVNYDVDEVLLKDPAFANHCTTDAVDHFINCMLQFDHLVVETFYPSMVAEPKWGIKKNATTQFVLDSIQKRSVIIDHITQTGVSKPAHMVLRIGKKDNGVKEGEWGLDVYRYNPLATDPKGKHTRVLATQASVDEEGVVIPAKSVLDNIRKGSLIRCVITRPAIWKSGTNRGIFWYCHQITIYQDGAENMGFVEPQPCVFDEEAFQNPPAKRAKLQD
jgi:hypothetical protein